MKILVGLSGGVDSAVAAYLLKEQGNEVTGAMMSIWDNSLAVSKNGTYNACFGPEDEDIEMAHRIADFIKIPFHVLDCRKEYKELVIENFKKEYKEGRTPNPCVWCNAYIKFGILPFAAQKAGVVFDKFATGHYANIKFNDSLNMYQLYKAADKNKDQTYFLHRLPQKILSSTVFPIGKYTKDKVRNIAKKIGLAVAEKPDSQDFYCGNYNDILKFPINSGNIVNKRGEILGKHYGVWNYTIGKRKGLGLRGGTKNPLYVINILAKQNIVVVGSQEDLYSSYLIAKEVSWSSIPIPKKSLEVTAKIRQQHRPAKAIVIPYSDGSVKVEFNEPQMSITSGQSVVFYEDDIVLGGGVIYQS
ncbi:MAG: tRNA 2-thiouridine(34) synthase MnmA [Endomicrobium sp.]|jgi:tRNA-specific 2-thiouridylase|nr:tRNA 2-thiouridine(34) synthase MnmA [Endomicrobium sp.]